MNKITKQTEDILKKALAHINSVEYKVSLRWLFYRLLQDGLYTKKKDYANCKSLFSRVRKRFEYGFKPDTFADETRAINGRGINDLNKKEWLEKLECHLDKIQNQDYVLLIFYEAKAMTSQFEHYTQNIPLVAFGGDASIPYKWDIAKTIELMDKRYKKPVKVLYFGDADKKGGQIYASALKDIKKWCSVKFGVKLCGLTIAQAKAYKLPENPDKPNQYQWEALSDTQAKDIITRNVKQYQDETRFAEIEKQEERILKEAKEKLK